MIRDFEVISVMANKFHNSKKKNRRNYVVAEMIEFEPNFGPMRDRRDRRKKEKEKFHHKFNDNEEYEN